MQTENEEKLGAWLRAISVVALVVFFVYIVGSEQNP